MKKNSKIEIQSIRDLDKETWRIFVAYCKFHNLNAGPQLSKILEGYVKKKKKKFKQIIK